MKIYKGRKLFFNKHHGSSDLDIFGVGHSSERAFGVKMTSINVDATSSRRIDVNTTSFWHQMPAGIKGSNLSQTLCWMNLKLCEHVAIIQKMCRKVFKGQNHFGKIHAFELRHFKC